MGIAHFLVLDLGNGQGGFMSKEGAICPTVKRLSAALGAEITGLSLRNPTEELAETIEALLLEHQVLFFPDQHIDVDSHVALGELFGPLEGHPNIKQDPTQHPKLFRLEASRGGIADEWHSDITFQPQPSKMSILHMVTCPPVGGDTMWSNLYLAFESLSKPLQDLCLKLTALHDAHPHNHPEQTAIHPVVRKHPDTGRAALYVNEHFTRRLVEMTAQESDILLGYLTKWVASPKFTVRYSWEPGTVCIWDNRCTQHFVINDFEGERVIERITVMGDEVAAAGGLNAYEPYVRQGPLSATSRHDRQLHFHLQSSK